MYEFVAVNEVVLLIPCVVVVGPSLVLHTTWGTCSHQY